MTGEVPPTTRHHLDQVASQRGKFRTDLIHDAIEEHLERLDPAGTEQRRLSEQEPPPDTK